MEIVEAAWELARSRGLLDWTLRDVAQRVGMRAPSIYTHFESKLAIYDAMFGQAWAEYEELSRAARASEDFPRTPRAAITALSTLFFDFAVADPARQQLMNQRSIPGFAPSEESFAASVRVLEMSLAALREMGVTDRGDVEIWFALLGGLINQQLANDPDGHSRRDLLGRALDMWCDAVGLPPEFSEAAGPALDAGRASGSNDGDHV